MDAQKKNITKWIIPAFLMLCLAQLYLPLKMIAEQESVVQEGKVFRFKVAPLDPNDPFRGKYITLRYEANSVKVKNANDWMGNYPVYVAMKTDAHGFAVIDSITVSQPTDNINYVKARVSTINGNDTNMLYVEYPFARFYMEETKSVKAEKMFLQSLQNPVSNTYALVYIRDGKAVIYDVLVNGISVRDVR